MLIGNRYQHYKGNKYKVIASAKHSETLEDLVVYQDLNDSAKIWARPKNMFEDKVTIEGEQVERFRLIS